MISGRLKQLQKFLDEDPADPFNWYALALEYLKSDQKKALTLFEKLLADFDQYLPTYYQAALLYIQLEESRKAVNVFEKGIALARDQNNLKAANELRSALDELLY
ncbi:MAG TPA: tetratricopeptide repeat protein [Cyclobacteriaceae bacterium]|nr:tetratricopeptide repeat protein [Cyclobacteriaceae bacterium]